MLFAERFGRRGRPAREYWTYEVGHILPSITRENIGTLRASDLMGAVRLFDGKYRPEEDG